MNSRFLDIQSTDLNHFDTTQLHIAAWRQKNITTHVHIFTSSSHLEQTAKFLSILQIIRVSLAFAIWLKLTAGFVVAAVVYFFLISGNKTPDIIKRHFEIFR